MSQPNEFIQNIFHIYDPIDRHERYLRERQLQGRKPGKKVPTVGKSGTLHPKGGATRPTKPPIKKAIPKKSAAEVRKETLAQVEALKTRLEQLREVLRKLVEQAQARAGDSQITTKDQTDKKPSHTTAAQKKKAAEASQKFRDKHKNDTPTPSEELKTLQTKIKNIQKKIEEMRAKLKAAVPATGRVQTQDRGSTPLRKPGTVGVGTQQRLRKENSQNGRS